MDFFNKAKDSLTVASKGITQKASDVSGIAKITVKMKEEEKQIENTLHELGAQLYNMHHEECARLFPELTVNLKQLYSSMEKDRIELAFLKGKKVCPNCGAELDMEVMNCTVCGINVENVERPSKTQQTPAFCQNCGSPLVEGSKFCNNCGAKVE